MGDATRTWVYFISKSIKDTTPTKSFVDSLEWQIHKSFLGFSLKKTSKKLIALNSHSKIVYQ